MNLSSLGNKVLARLAPYLEEKQPPITTERCCVYLDSTYLQLIHINKKENAIELLHAETFEFDQLENLPLVLSGFVEKSNLNKIPTYWLLSPGDYQLFMIDSLPVPKDEIRAALSWRLRSLLSYPIDEAAIDFFMIPAKKSAPEHPMISAVAARKNQLSKTIDMLEKSGLPLMVIDVPELALKNLSSLNEDDEKCTAFIYFTPDSVLLNISREKTLYFTRRIQLPQQVRHEELYGNISLEIMRYFDYFQSQWRHPSPTRIYLYAKHANAPEIAEALSKNLMTTVDIFSLEALLPDKKARELIETRYLLTFGSALREGYQHVPTKD